jgi:hypothetical protein
MERLKAIAREALDTFEAIAIAARGSLGGRGITLNSLASINEMTASNVATEMRQMNDQRQSDCVKLLREPSIARLVIADEDDNRQVLYISSGGTVGSLPIAFCSYMSPKGGLAALNIGDSRKVKLPGGLREFEVLEKISFRPIEAGSGWDSKPAVQYREKLAPFTIRSLRDLLLDDGDSEVAIDVFEAWAAAQSASAGAGNVIEGIQRDALTAMQLRVAPILDAFQDRIFRLPIDCQIAVLGPPGTGKTTTLVKRLRQKVDFVYLDPDTERSLVEGPDAAGLTHADSWLMFSPTELLRQYVKEAFGKEGVPVHDERVRTWDDYRREVGRRNVGILRAAHGGGGLVLKNDNQILLPETLASQIPWFEAFNAHQEALFVGDLEAEAQRLQAAVDPRAAMLGKQIFDAITRNRDLPLQLVSELANLGDRLREVAAAGRDEQRTTLQAPLNGYARSNPKFLDDMMRFVESLSAIEDDEAEAEESDGEDDDAQLTTTLRDPNVVRNIFLKAMRSRAIAQATGRTPAAASRAGRLLAWLQERGLELPDLRKLGAALLVQRSAQRLARAPNAYVSGVPLRYRRFRRTMREQNRWYVSGRSAASDAHPSEVDIILLAMVRTARDMERNATLMRRLADRAPPLLNAIARLRRNQVLVDEATDFSPVQLACMRALASFSTNSFFVSGDFNQRLTRWGIRSEADLLWISPGMTIERIDVSYRQSRLLANFARALGQTQGYEINDRAPDHMENLGYPPVLGVSLASLPEQADWLANRIREINAITSSALPTIAVLVCSADALEPLAGALTEKLRDMNIQAVACPKGMVKGQAGDVRIFEIEHIKGLEFEAVFFTDIDTLKEREPDLFDRYVYVGATRAATFLGLTCSGENLPSVMEPVVNLFEEHWL